MATAVEVASPYLHSYIVHCLTTVRGLRSEVEQILSNAIGYLHETRDSSGWWSFFSKRADPGADVDDSAVSYEALLAAHFPFEGNSYEEAVQWLDSIERVRQDSGLFCTWRDRTTNDLDSGPDMAVNANLLLLMGSVGRRDCSLEHRFFQILKNAEYRENNRYAASKLALPYLVSRCYRDGQVHSLEPGMRDLAEHVIGMQESDGGWGNDLDTALALICLMNAGWRGTEVDGAIASLAARQDADGGWRGDPFFCDFLPNYYGSRSFTSALCLESIARISNYN